MSRWSDDPEHAADALILDCLSEIELSGSILLANQTGSLPAAVAARGLTPSTWNRRLGNAGSAQPWPPQGPFDCAFLRIPKAKAELEMDVHALLTVLKAGGRLIVYGGNDEGIRSAAALLADIADTADTLAARGHGRVLAGTRPVDTGRLRGRLSDWRQVSRVTIAGTGRDWVSYPGVFSAGRIDGGTALLLTALPALGAGGRVLDYGCGAGVISAAVQAIQPNPAIDMLDNDSVALEAARENVPGARAILGVGLANARNGRYDAILSNPPLHEGVAETHKLLEGLIAGAPALLAPRGILQMVVQRRVPLERTLAQHFGSAQVVAENGRYRVWRAARA